METYTSDQVIAIRNSLIEQRDKALVDNNFVLTVLLSHTIAILAEHVLDKQLAESDHPPVPVHDFIGGVL